MGDDGGVALDVACKDGDAQRHGLQNGATHALVLGAVDQTPALLQQQKQLPLHQGTEESTAREQNVQNNLCPERGGGKEKERERQRDRETEKETETETKRQTEGKRRRCTHIQPPPHTHTPTCGSTGCTSQTGDEISRSLTLAA